MPCDLLEALFKRSWAILWFDDKGRSKILYWSPTGEGRAGSFAEQFR